MDPTGKVLVVQETVMNKTNLFNLNLSGKSLSAGVYLLEITLNGQQRVERVLKQ